MTEQDQKSFPWQDYAMQIPSPCGRVFSIPMGKIRNDYAEFRMQEDGFTSVDEALKGTDFSDVRSWFMNQFTWEDVDRLGVCEQEASAQDMQRALDSMRNRANPQTNATMERRDDWISGRISQEMEEVLPQTSAGSRGPLGRF